MTFVPSFAREPSAFNAVVRTRKACRRVVNSHKIPERPISSLNGTPCNRYINLVRARLLQIAFCWFLQFRRRPVSSVMRWRTDELTTIARELRDDPGAPCRSQAVRYFPLDNGGALVGECRVRSLFNREVSGQPFSIERLAAGKSAICKRRRSRPAANRGERLTKTAQSGISGRPARCSEVRARSKNANVRVYHGDRLSGGKVRS
jgi:hypothetical protein